MFVPHSLESCIKPLAALVVASCCVCTDKALVIIAVNLALEQNRTTVDAAVCVTTDGELPAKLLGIHTIWVVVLVVVIVTAHTRRGHIRVGHQLHDSVHVVNDLHAEGLYRTQVTHLVVRHTRPMLSDVLAYGGDCLLVVLPLALGLGIGNTQCVTILRQMRVLQHQQV